MVVSGHTEKENKTPAATVEDSDEGPPAKKQRYVDVLDTTTVTLL